ncbi:hypothetical protein HK097_004254 [Rhizophlyctis rosea]|uniref:Uncharacterized protein n=1 Tax=Rhizophlyctis rosea TaxID=64517 RepID=A0AAD5X779_9FUNG|nr:hypothetical protein HK097_004254 [Rhizophlyctis rosea]
MSTAPLPALPGRDAAGKRTTEHVTRIDVVRRSSSPTERPKTRSGPQDRPIAASAEPNTTPRKTSLTITQPSSKYGSKSKLPRPTSSQKRLIPSACLSVPRQKDLWEHRHYPTIHPTCNKLLSRRWEEHAKNLHLRKLKEARASVDNKVPRRYPHLEMRLKRLQIEEERLYEIERSNHILLDRIAFQLVNASQVSDLEQARRIAHVEDELGGHWNAAGTLNGPKRRKDWEKIQNENMTILQRIEDKAPYYDRRKWLEERHKSLSYLANIAQYPLPYYRELGLISEDPDFPGYLSDLQQDGEPPDAQEEGQPAAEEEAQLEEDGAEPDGRPVTRNGGGFKGEGEESESEGEENVGEEGLDADVEERELPPPGETGDERPPTRPGTVGGSLDEGLAQEDTQPEVQPEATEEEHIEPEAPVEDTQPIPAEEPPADDAIREPEPPQQDDDQPKPNTSTTYQSDFTNPYEQEYEVEEPHPQSEEPTPKTPSRGPSRYGSQTQILAGDEDARYTQYESDDHSFGDENYGERFMSRTGAPDEGLGMTKSQSMTPPEPAPVSSAQSQIFAGDEGTRYDHGSMEFVPAGEETGEGPMSRVGAQGLGMNKSRSLAPVEPVEPPQAPREPSQYGTESQIFAGNEGARYDDGSGEFASAGEETGEGAMSRVGTQGLGMHKSRSFAPVQSDEAETENLQPQPNRKRSQYGTESQIFAGNEGTTYDYGPGEFVIAGEETGEGALSRVGAQGLGMAKKSASLVAAEPDPVVVKGQLNRGASQHGHTSQIFAADEGTRYDAGSQEFATAGEETGEGAMSRVGARGLGARKSTSEVVFEPEPVVEEVQPSRGVSRYGTQSQVFAGDEGARYEAGCQEFADVGHEIGEGAMSRVGARGLAGSQKGSQKDVRGQEVKQGVVGESVGVEVEPQAVIETGVTDSRVADEPTSSSVRGSQANLRSSSRISSIARLSTGGAPDVADQPKAASVRGSRAKLISRTASAQLPGDVPQPTASVRGSLANIASRTSSTAQLPVSTVDDTQPVPASVPEPAARSPAASRRGSRTNLTSRTGSTTQLPASAAGDLQQPVPSSVHASRTSLKGTSRTGSNIQLTSEAPAEPPTVSRPAARTSQTNLTSASRAGSNAQLSKEAPAVARSIPPSVRGSQSDLKDTTRSGSFARRAAESTPLPASTQASQSNLQSGSRAASNARLSNDEVVREAIQPPSSVRGSQNSLPASSRHGSNAQIQNVGPEPAPSSRVSRDASRTASASDLQGATPVEPTPGSVRWSQKDLRSASRAGSTANIDGSPSALTTNDQLSKSVHSSQLELRPLSRTPSSSKIQQNDAPGSVKSSQVDLRPGSRVVSVAQIAGGNTHVNSSQRDLRQESRVGSSAQVVSDQPAASRTGSRVQLGEGNVPQAAPERVASVRSSQRDLRQDSQAGSSVQVNNVGTSQPMASRTGSTVQLGGGGDVPPTGVASVRSSQRDVRAPSRTASTNQIPNNDASQQRLPSQSNRASQQNLSTTSRAPSQSFNQPSQPQSIGRPSSASVRASQQNSRSTSRIGSQQFLTDRVATEGVVSGFGGGSNRQTVSSLSGDAGRPPLVPGLPGSKRGSVVEV